MQTGGPSGGCIPAELLDLGVSYDALIKVGSMMGSGGMIVMDDTSCMVNVARFFIEFCMTESCGKCIPCRAGTAQMFTRCSPASATAPATMDDLDLLIDLCATVKETSLCGLGQTAPNPVLSTLKYFKNEYIEHIVNKRCPRRRLQYPGSRAAVSPGGDGMSASVDVKTLIIDGQEVSARAGQTILEVAREHDIDIPTLCHLDGLSDVGACRLCVVEIKGNTKLFPACVTTVYEGMEVTTESDRLRKHRQTILELLFAERNHICSVCVSNGHCELQTLAQPQGVTHVALPYRNPALPVDASHERFTLDHNRCILCTRCVRVCAEIEGAHVWDVMGRGIDSLIISDLNQPWGESTCTRCGKCVQVCPTGALFDKSKIGSDHPKYPDFLPYLNLMREAQ